MRTQARNIYSQYSLQAKCTVYSTDFLSLTQYTLLIVTWNVGTSNCKDIELLASVSLIQQLGEISEQMENIILRKGLRFESE